MVAPSRRMCERRWSKTWACGYEDEILDHWGRTQDMLHQCTREIGEWCTLYIGFGLCLLPVACR